MASAWLRGIDQGRDTHHEELIRLVVRHHGIQPGLCERLAEERVRKPREGRGDPVEERRHASHACLIVYPELKGVRRRQCLLKAVRSICDTHIEDGEEVICEHSAGHERLAD